VITYRINAGFIPKEHWTQDPAEGGGRIIGEVCHFVDLMTYLVNSVPIKVYADVISSTREDIVNKDNVSIVLKFRDGSIGTIIYAASGDGSFPKERIEMFCENSVAVIDDFRKTTLTRAGKTKAFGTSRQDKGHRAEVNAFIESVSLGQASPLAFQDGVNATIVTFRILDSLSEGRPVQVRLDDRQEALDEIGRIYTHSVLNKS
jgi:polar amino acid transport system substrate-binding protein